MKWNPAKVIARICRATAQAAGRQIRAAQGRVSHRDAGRVDPRTGGTLSSQVQARAFVAEKPWGAVLRWSTLGLPGLAFIRGTKRQKPRPVVMSPSVPELVAAVREDASRYFGARAARMGAP